MAFAGSGEIARHQLKSGGELVVAHAQPEDATGIIDYLNRVGGETDFLTFGANEFWLSVDQEEAFLRAVQPDLGWMLKGTVDGRMVASLSLLRTSKPRLKHIAELGISVLKDSWGQNIGRRLCEAAFALARQSGVRKINLRVREDNSRAIRIYEKLGFERIGLSTRAYFIEGRFHSEVLMGLDVD